MTEHAQAHAHAIISGAGSGVGRAVALALAKRGWSVSLIGRRAAALEGTRGAAGTNASLLDAYPLDLAEAADVARAVTDATARRGPVLALVNAAGNNVPRRSLAELELDDWRAVLDANLNGAFYLVRAVLPAMRQARAGTIVNIVSEAGLRANAKAGAAYVASKFALSGLTQSINAEEQLHGIRATAIFPGDIDTPLLDKRAVPPSPEARLHLLRPEDVAACVLFALELPERAVLEELVVRPRARP